MIKDFRRSYRGYSIKTQNSPVLDSRFFNKVPGLRPET